MLDILKYFEDFNLKCSYSLEIHTQTFIVLHSLCFLISSTYEPIVACLCFLENGSLIKIFILSGFVQGVNNLMICSVNSYNGLKTVKSQSGMIMCRI